jgi:hypothetical protein
VDEYDPSAAASASGPAQAPWRSRRAPRLICDVY